MTFASDQISRPPEGAIRNFSQLIQYLEDGQFHSNLTVAMEKLIREINDHAMIGRKAKGKITITIDLTSDRGAVEPSGHYTVKGPPEPRLRSAFLYITNGGFLSARDPRQGQMTVHSVDGERARIVVAD